MCGICGFFSRNRITEDELRGMNDTMYHRGPDDHGYSLYPAGEGYCVGMAQRRLAIMDLSPLGHQPMESEDGRVVVVFNGEIYNFNRLKEELSDYPFVSTCDTEVILAAYQRWGISCIEKLNGMFAIAIFDRKEDTLYLIRDRIGKKPLYYWIKGGNMVFASELKPIMKCPGFDAPIRKEVISRFLYQQYICEPDSIFEGVSKVCPGEVVSFCHGQVKKYHYWNIKKIYKEKKGTFSGNYEEAKEQLLTLIKGAVRDRLVADVPVGTFLSGGYDSSMVTAIAQQISASPVKTFSIGFYEEKYNEAGYAKEVANHLGCDHTELYVSEQDLLGMMDSLPVYYDEPFADSSQIPSMLVSKLAREKVTVALSGDGGDEFFCGYQTYKRVRQAQLLDAVGAVAGAFGNVFHMMDKYPFKFRVIAGNRNRETKTQFAVGNYRKAAEAMVLYPEGGNPVSCLYEFESRYGEGNWQARRMLLDMETYLPGDILCKVDRASMKYSLETRCPILDQNVMEYSMTLPHSFKYNKGTGKRILKDITYQYLPRELMERPKKGFSVPLDKWLRGILKEQVLSYADVDFLKKQQIFDVGYTRNFLESYMKKGDAGPGTGENYSHLAWSFFMFQKWYEAYVPSRL